MRLVQTCGRPESSYPSSVTCSSVRCGWFPRRSERSARSAAADRLRSVVVLGWWPLLRWRASRATSRETSTCVRVCAQTRACSRRKGRCTVGAGELRRPRLVLRLHARARRSRPSVRVTSPDHQQTRPLRPRTSPRISCSTLVVLASARRPSENASYPSSGGPRRPGCDSSFRCVLRELGCGCAMHVRPSSRIEWCVRVRQSQEARRVRARQGTVVTTEGEGAEGRTADWTTMTRRPRWS